MLELNVEVQEKFLVMMIMQHFSSIDISFSKYAIRRIELLPKTVGSRSVQNKQDRSLARGIQIFNFGNLKGASASKKTARTTGPSTKKTAKDARERQDEIVEAMVYFDFDESLKQKLWTGYNAPSLAKES